MSPDPSSRCQPGWRPFFAQQLSLEELETLKPARVSAVHRTRVDAMTGTGTLHATVSSVMVEAGLSASVAVGDWVLIDPGTRRIVRVLDRQTVIGRLAAGERQERQLIAANIDALFVVTSCNDDFNLSRLERYLALAQEAGMEPVVVLTKVDLVDGIDRHVDALRDIAPHVAVCAVNATDVRSVSVLAPWLREGQTVAFVGSSGVGKSTLVNTLAATALQDTAGIREGDSKGRHTTTARQLFALPGGAWVIDTPGMRELKLDVGEQAVSAVFSDIDAIATRCRFRDCAHEGDAGCAVLLAIERGELDGRRLASYRKLLREAARATRTVREQREHYRQFGKAAKSIMKQKRIDRGRTDG